MDPLSNSTWKYKILGLKNYNSNTIITLHTNINKND